MLVMYKSFISYIIILCLISFVSCKKDKQWKLPTDLHTKVYLRNTISSSNNIQFTDGSITITEYKFNGEREQGDDMFFTKPLSNGINIPFSNNLVNELEFDIPQGTYDKVIISLRTYSTNTITLNGTYTDINGDKYPLKFEMSSEEYFSTIALSSSVSNTIVFDKDIPMTAYISFDPVYWFQTISVNMLEDIIVHEEESDKEDETGIILINKNSNSSLYDIIINRIGQELSIQIY